MNEYPRAHWYLMLGLAVVVGGFIPSYWSRELSGFQSSIHVHAGTATLWFVTLIVQPWLVTTGRARHHRIFGRLAVVNAVALAITAALITPRNLELQTGNPNLPYMFIFWDVATISVFAVYVLLGVRHRKNVPLHARYMLATVFVPLLPALARGLFFYGVVDDFVSALYVGNALTLAVISLLIYDDFRRGTLHRPYLALYGIFVVLGVSVEIVGASVWWQTLVDAAVEPLVWTVLLGSVTAAIIVSRPGRNDRAVPVTPAE